VLSLWLFFIFYPRVLYFSLFDFITLVLPYSFFIPLCVMISMFYGDFLLKAQIIYCLKLWTCIKSKRFYDKIKYKVGYINWQRFLERKILHRY